MPSKLHRLLVPFTLLTLLLAALPPSHVTAVDRPPEREGSLPVIVQSEAAEARALPGAALPQETINFGNRVAFFPLISRQFVPPTPEPPQPPPAQPDIDVTLRSSPRNEVVPGDRLTYELRVRNRGVGASGVIGLSFAYDVRLDLVDSQFSGGDGIVEIDDFGDVTARMTLAINPLAPNTSRTTNLIFRVNRRNIHPGDQLGARATFACSNNPAAECRSNTITLDVVDDGDDGGGGGEIRLSVSPDRGPPGTRHRFSTDRFRPGERVVTWLNTPRGVEELDQVATADGNGRVSFELRTSGYAVGDYSLVAYGQQSDITGVGPFRVQGPGGLLQAAPQALIVAPTKAAPALRTAAAPAQAGRARGGGGIAGKLAGPDGQPLAGVRVFIRDSAGLPVDSTVSLPSGTFLVASGLATGAYTVEVVPRLSTNPVAAGLLETTIPSVTVTSPQLTRIPTTTLEAGVSISGTVRGDVGAGVSGVAVLVATDAATDTVVAATISGHGGAYTTPPLAAGSYTLTFLPVRSFRDATQSYSATTRSGVSVVPPSPTTGVDVSLSRHLLDGQIAGRVTGAGGVGLEQALVRITAADGSLADVETTAVDGSYTTKPLAGGVYTVEVLTRFSTVPTTTQYIGGPTSPPTATVTPGQVTLNIDAQLSAGGGIAGRLLGAPTGTLTQPLALADVPVLVLDAASGELAGFAVTGATGVYTVAGLPSGSYKVWFLSDLSADSTARGYISSYYGGATKSGAQVAQVTAPNTSADIGATLQAGARLSGRISGEGGVALEDVLVLVYEGGTGDQAAVRTLTASGANGFYLTPALPDGSYRLAFAPAFSTAPGVDAYLTRYSGGAAQLDAATAVTVSLSSPPPAVSITLPKGGQIGGRVTAADQPEEGLAGVLVTVYSGTSADSVVAVPTTDADGSYTTPGLELGGSYRLSFAPAASFDPVVRGYQQRFLGGALTLADPATEALLITTATVVTGKNIALPPRS